MDRAIEFALRTWYEKDHPLHFDPLHPAIGLAGEAGELLDLYKKERFKSGVSWWDCVCGHKKHNKTLCYADNALCKCIIYTPKILDELGDLWYYLRILAYQLELPISTSLLQSMPPAMDVILSQLNIATAKFLEGTIIEIRREDKGAILNDVNYWFYMTLKEVDCTLDQLTELNWQKLKYGDNHGWKGTRESNPINQPE